MPDPKELRVGDRVRFVSLPEEWSQPDFTVPDDTLRFMKALVARPGSSRVCEIDQHGIPWINARISVAGTVEHHYWGIHEHTGWTRVISRS